MSVSRMIGWRSRLLVMAYGILVALFAAQYMNFTIPDAAALMRSREAGVEASIAALASGRPPLFLPREASGSDDVLLPRGDDPGLFLYLPILGNLLGVADAPFLLKWSFIALMSLLFALLPSFVLETFGSSLAAVLSPAALAYQLPWLMNTDIYWISAWCLVLCLFGLLVVDLNWPRQRRLAIATLISVLVVASFATSVRSLAGLPVLLAAFLVVFRSVRTFPSRALLSLVAVAAFLSIAPIGIDAVRAYRDGQVSGTVIPPVYTTPWHSVYLGLGFLDNRYGIRYEDGVAQAAVLTENPNVGYLTPRYGDVLRGLVFRIAASDPGFVIETVVVKAALVARHALERFWPLILLLPPVLFARGQSAKTVRRGFILAAPALAYGVLPPVLVMPYPDYELGLFGALGYALVLGSAWAATTLQEFLFRVRHLARRPASWAAALGDLLRIARSRSLGTPRPRLFAASAGLIVIVILASEALMFVGAKLDRVENVHYYRGRESPMGPRPAGAAVASWDFSATLPSTWLTLPGTTTASGAGSLLVTTNTKRWDYQLMGPVVGLQRGSYLAYLEGEVLEGGIELGILDSSRSSWITTTHFWDQQFRAGGLAVARFALPEQSNIRVILSNWSLREHHSRWSLRAVLVAAAP